MMEKDGVGKSTMGCIVTENILRCRDETSGRVRDEKRKGGSGEVDELTNRREGGEIERGSIEKVSARLSAIVTASVVYSRRVLGLLFS